MLLFSLSLSLQSLINYYQILSIISSFCLIINQNLINCKKRNILFITIIRFDLILMLHTKISSSSSKSTFVFDTSLLQTNNSKESNHSTKSIICFNEKNFNRNANDTNEDLEKEKRFLHRLVQSSTDLSTKDFYSSINRDNPHRTNGAIRIESALMTSDYSHLLSQSIIHSSRPIIDINMNRTIDLIKRNGAGDENLSSHSHDKQVQTPIIMDNNHYLTLEQVPIYNRRKIQFTSKQLILITISVFVLVVSLCLLTVFFIF